MSQPMLYVSKRQTPVTKSEKKKSMFGPLKLAYDKYALNTKFKLVT